MRLLTDSGEPILAVDDASELVDLATLVAIGTGSTTLEDASTIEVVTDDSASNGALIELDEARRVLTITGEKCDLATLARAVQDIAHTGDGGPTRIGSRLPVSRESVPVVVEYRRGGTPHRAQAS